MGVSTHIFVARRARERALDTASRAAEHRRTVDLPYGYTLSGGEGGYWTLRDREGEVVVGPSRGKWQGRDGATDAAWRDVAGR